MRMRAAGSAGARGKKRGARSPTGTLCHRSRGKKAPAKGTQTIHPGGGKGRRITRGQGCGRLATPYQRQPQPTGSERRRTCAALAPGDTLNSRRRGGDRQQEWRWRSEATAARDHGEGAPQAGSLGGWPSQGRRQPAAEGNVGRWRSRGGRRQRLRNSGMCSSLERLPLL